MKSAIAIIGLAAAVTGGWVGFTRYDDLRDEVDLLADERADAPAREGLLRSELTAVLARVEGLQAELAAQDARADEEQAAQVAVLAELDALAQALAEQAAALDAERARLAALEGSAIGAADLDARLDEISDALDATRQGLEGRIVEAAVQAEESLRGVDALGSRMPTPRDTSAMWRELVGPVVQLAGDASVGSGVVLRSRPSADGESFDTYLLTAWHVVRDIQGSLDARDEPVPVAIYDEHGTITHETASLLAHDAGIDVALLKMDIERALPDGAVLAPRSRVDAVSTFDRVYAVGCPLGNDPIPTHGEVASPRHLVDGDTYWMINAPTFIGNSGGGIFDAETHELLGLFSKIYNYGSMRPTIVPHMGLVTPLTVVYDWLEENGHVDLVPPGPESDGAGLANG